MCHSASFSAPYFHSVKQVWKLGTRSLHTDTIFLESHEYKSADLTNNSDDACPTSSATVQELFVVAD